MLDLNEILDKGFYKKILVDEKKFKILSSKKINIEVIKYIINRLCNLYIDVTNEYEGTLFQLMFSNKLQGWCWQTTESAIIFLNDDDYIERGYLYIDSDNPNYYHSWICFNFNGVEYVLDPCLRLLCKKKHYSKIFQTDVKGKVYARVVKDELIKHVNLLQKQDYNELILNGPEDVNTPFYRNGSGYKTEIDGNKIKKISVRYYWY